MALRPLLDSWREQRNDARQLLIRELDSDSYRRWVEEYREFVRREGAGVADVSPTRPHRIRDRAAVAGHGGVRGGSGLRAGHALGGRRDAPRPADRGKVASLHARVHPRDARAGRRCADHEDRRAPGPSRCSCTMPTSPPAMARTFLVENAGRLTTTQSAAIGRFLVDREKELARLRRTVGPAWRGVAGARSDSAARSDGGLAPTLRASPVGRATFVAGTS